MTCRCVLIDGDALAVNFHHVAFAFRLQAYDDRIGRIDFDNSLFHLSSYLVNTFCLFNIDYNWVRL